MLFHDPKFDIPSLRLALKSKAFYIGFLGSRKTQAERRASLSEIGFKEQDLERIHGPVGLDIGGKEPGMIALSILSEIVAVRHRRDGGMMSKSRREAVLPSTITSITHRARPTREASAAKDDG